MNETVALTLLSICVATITAIAVAAIPWAFNVHGKLTAMTHFMAENGRLRDRVVRLEVKAGIGIEE